MGETRGLAKPVLVLVGWQPITPRIVKLATHLPLAGWRPTVLVPRRRSADVGFGKMGSGIRVVETSRLASFGELARWLVRRFRPQSSNHDGWGDTPSGRLQRQGMVQQWVRRILLWTAVPDELAGWIPWAIGRGFSLIRKEHAQAILASGAPFSVLLAGAFLEMATGRVFVADFRDAWVQDPTDPQGSIGGLFRAPYGPRWLALLGRLERFVIDRADLVTFTSEVTLERYRAVYPVLSEKGRVIYNGVDEEDFAYPEDASEAFAFTYIGTLHDIQAPQLSLFLHSFAMAVNDEPGFAACRVRIRGYRPSGLTDHLIALAARLSVTDRVSVGGPIPHFSAVAMMKSRGVQVLLNGDSTFIRLTKVSECLAAQRPILSLGPDDSGTNRDLRPLGHACYSGASVDELKGILINLWRQHRSDPSPSAAFPFPEPHPFNWRTAARTLGSEMDRLCEQRQPVPDMPK